MDVNTTFEIIGIIEYMIDDNIRILGNKGIVKISQKERTLIELREHLNDLITAQIIAEGEEFEELRQRLE
jgi:hypothetical protein